MNKYQDRLGKLYTDKTIWKIIKWDKIYGAWHIVNIWIGKG